MAAKISRYAAQTAAPRGLSINLAGRLGQSMDDALIAVHRQNNQATRNARDLFGMHRKQLMGLLLRMPGGRLAVLGAGNGNDLDWDVLLRAFDQIHIFDIDEEAIGHLMAGLPKPTDRVVCHAALDLAGTAASFPTWRSRRLSSRDLEFVATDAVAQVACNIGQTYDVIVSPCLLSQVMHGARVALGCQHPDLRAVAICQQLGHLRLLSHLLSGNGCALLATDVASNDDIQLRSLKRPEVAAQALCALTARGGCFTGTDPLQTLAMLEADELLVKSVQAQLPLQTWVWQISPQISYLVAALTIARKTLT